jgi:ubiquinone/menaquinone biosynthesis C-methylase UbiE
MHPEDRKYFEDYARGAREASMSLADYYVAIQAEENQDVGKIKVNLEAQKLNGMKHVRSFMKPDESLLIVGCGVGYEIDWFRKQGFTKITGLDIREDRLQLCAERYGVPTVCADMSDTKLEDQSYTHVLTRQSLHHVFYPYQALEELARIAARTVSIVSEPALTWFKETLRTTTGARVISRFQIYEYQFRIKDVHRYMAFNGFEVLGTKKYLETPRLPYALHQAVSACVPFLRNRFSAIYRRMGSSPDRGR